MARTSTDLRMPKARNRSTVAQWPRLAATLTRPDHATIPARIARLAKAAAVQPAILPSRWKPVRDMALAPEGRGRGGAGARLVEAVDRLNREDHGRQNVAQGTGGNHQQASEMLVCQ